MIEPGVEPRRTRGSGTLKPRSQNRFGLVASTLLCGLILGWGAPTLASPATLKRSLSNITQAPLDLILSPMVGVLSVVTGMNDQADPVAVRVVFAVPGVIWNTGVIVGASVIRFVTGGLEFAPGVLLLPFEADLDTLFSAVDSAGALVEMETPCCIDVKFGLNYTLAEY